jgi:hypothetical protein
MSNPFAQETEQAVSDGLQGSLQNVNLLRSMRPPKGAGVNVEANITCEKEHGI